MIGLIITGPTSTASMSAASDHDIQTGSSVKRSSSTLASTTVPPGELSVLTAGERHDLVGGHLDCPLSDHPRRYFLALAGPGSHQTRTPAIHLEVHLAARCDPKSLTHIAGDRHLSLARHTHGQRLPQVRRSGITSTSYQDSDRGDLLLVGHAEGRAAAAGSDDVGVRDLEARALEALLVVDHRATYERQALVVDEQLQPVALEHDVAVALLVERELILKARAAAPAHTYAQARHVHVGVLRGEELLDLLGTLVANGDHRFPKYSG